MGEIMKASILALMVAATVAFASFPSTAGELTLPPPASNATQSSPSASSLPYPAKNLFLAGALSIIPGLGQIYNGKKFVGSMWMIADIGLYAGAAAYAGLFNSHQRMQLGTESIFLLTLGIGFHLFSIYDAVTEAARINEDLNKFSANFDPGRNAFTVAYRFRF
jgi:hypothetical protein